MALNIRSKQLAAVERMLRLDDGQGALVSQQWKVLIYDAHCRGIISPLIHVRRLRENGVTLHMLIESPRESIPDVPAVYFMQPTMENVRLFVQDCQKQLYDTAYLNFSAPLPPALMEALAKQLVEINSVNVVAKVFDQYLGFVSLEPHLFSLNLRDSFARYNSPTLADTAIEACMEEITQGVTSAVATLGVPPIIRCPAGGPAEMVARKVCEAVRGLLEQQSSFFAQGTGRGVLEKRPLLLIADRSVDMSAPLMHTSGYQTLVDDLLGLHSNLVKVPAPEKKDAQGHPLPTQDPPRSFSLDKDSDSFWAKYAGALFPEAVDAQAKVLAQVEEQESKIRKKGDGAAGPAAAEDTGTSALLDTVSSLPALLEMKANLDRHLAILEATMAVVSKRQAHRFVEIEERMVFAKYAEKKKVEELAADATLTLRDKLRLLAVYMLSTNPSQEDADELENAVLGSSAGEALDPEVRDELLRTIRYVKKVLSLSRFGKGGGDQSPSRSQAGSGRVWDLANLTRTAIQNASRQVKSIVGESKLMSLTQLADLAMREVASESAVAEQDAQLLYLDPKVRGEVAPAARIRSGFNRGVVFVVGGGCYVEYQNLQDYAAGRVSASGAPTLSGGRGPSKRDCQVVYGCSELVNADAFMKQLAQCS